MDHNSKSRTAPVCGRGEEGYLLIGVLILLALMLITMAVAAPKIATEIQRDKESELYHRGQQYTRAIRLFYRKFGKYPTSVDQLENTSNIRFLRKRYKDPITGGDQWHIIHLGEAKLHSDNPFKVPPEFGSGAAAGTTLASNNVPPPPSVHYMGGVPSQQAGGQTFGLPTGSISTDSSSTSAQNVNNTSPATGDIAPTGTPGLTTTGTVIGGSIVGVSSVSPKKSIREYKRQQHYNQWEFTYDASQEMLGATGLGAPPPQAPAAQNSSNATGTPATPGNPATPALPQTPASPQ